MIFTAKYLCIFQYPFMHVVCANIFGAIVLKPRFKIDAVIMIIRSIVIINSGVSFIFLLIILQTPSTTQRIRSSS